MDRSQLLIRSRVQAGLVGTDWQRISEDSEEPDYRVKPLSEGHNSAIREDGPPYEAFDPTDEVSY
jgi:hypothetical protein